MLILVQCTTCTVNTVFIIGIGFYIGPRISPFSWVRIREPQIFQNKSTSLIRHGLCKNLAFITKCGLVLVFGIDFWYQEIFNAHVHLCKKRAKLFYFSGRPYYPKASTVKVVLCQDRYELSFSCTYIYHLWIIVNIGFKIQRIMINRTLDELEFEDKIWYF